MIFVDDQIILKDFIQFYSENLNVKLVSYPSEGNIVGRAFQLMKQNERKTFDFSTEEFVFYCRTGNIMKPKNTSTSPITSFFD